MTTEQFFQKFELLANAPNAIGEMREVVLNCAMRGQLVSQDPTDETANETLTRFPSGVVARFLKIANLPINGEPFSIPLSWSWIRLPRALKKLTDGTHHSPPNFATGAFKYVTAKNIKQNGIELSDITYVTPDVHDEIYSRCDPEKGDVLLIKDGATTGIATINQLAEPFSMLSSVALLKPTPAIYNRYLLWALRSPFYYQQTRGAMKGAAITRVNLTELAESVLPLPPLNEQKRIVTKVDELMGLCDRLEAQQTEREQKHAALARASLSRFAEAPTPANLEFLFHNAYTIDPADLRKSILSLAAQGKLIPTDANEWKTMALASIAAEIVDCPHSTPKWTPTGKICVRTNQFRPGFLDLSASRFVSGETFAERIVRLRPREDDVLYSREGGILGVACRVPPGAELCLGQRMMLIRCGPSVTPRFLELFLNSPVVTDIARRETTGGAAPRVNVATVKAYPIAVPPLAEQRRIVAKVDQLMALVDQLVAQLAASRATAEKLMEAVVAELTRPAEPESIVVVS